MIEVPAPKKIIWLASYPKSGNTWFRAFLTALLNPGDLNINEMNTDGIFSSRSIFDNFADIDSTDLYDDEVKTLLPEIFREVSRYYPGERLFIKIHDAYTINTSGKPIVPEEPTICAIYFMRNPLDVAGSFANHNGTSIDEAIELMNNPFGKMAKQPGNLNTNAQFRQLILNWSSHVESWTNTLPFPVLVLRYEDMISDTLGTFIKAVKFIGLTVHADQIQKAVAATTFEQLQQKEQEKGFAEKNIRSKKFFRKGRAGGWIDELTSAQTQLIMDYHKTMMAKYGYPTTTTDEIQ